MLNWWRKRRARREIDVLVEAQKQIEAMAQGVAESTRNLLQSRSEHRPTDAASYPDADLAFYDGVQRNLETLGFDCLGDVEDAVYNRRNPHAPSFYRFAVGGRGAAVAIWSGFRLRRFDDDGNPVLDANGNPIESDVDLSWLVLLSAMQGGTFLVTVMGVGDSGLPQPPQVDTRRLPGPLDESVAVGAHLERLAVQRSLPEQVRDLDGALALFERSEHLTRDYRRSLGFDIFAPILRHHLGAGYDDIGPQIEAVIRANPEWFDLDDALVDRPVLLDAAAHDA